MTDNLQRLSSIQQRTLLVLAATVILGGLSLASAITAGGLLVADVAKSDVAAGFGQTAIVLGAAVLAVPLARISSRSGRRYGLATGLSAGFFGSLVVVGGAVLDNLGILLLGLLLFGGAQATVLQARFSATDLSPPGKLGRDLSIILWMSAVGSIIGPNLSGPAAASAAHLGLPELAGPFFWAAIALLCAVALILVALRPDPLLLARESLPSAEQAPRKSLRQSLALVWHNRDARLAFATLICANAAMVGLMVMTPLHLTHTGHGLAIVGIVISIHVAGMFLFAPAFGWLADRMGNQRTIAIGMAVLVIAGLLATVTAAAPSVWVTIALFLLGLGWSICVVAGSALLSGSTSLDFRASAQGLGDLAMGLAGAVAGAVAGLVFGIGSYTILGVAVALISVPVLVWTVPHYWQPVRQTGSH